MTSSIEKETSCACYVAEFEGAKPGKINTLFYQVINDGGDVGFGVDGLDILVPGMGVGLMTQGCANQWKGFDIGKWGKQYGGLDRDAAGCANLPQDLQHGCMWRMKDWGDSVRIKGRPRRVRCSKAHIDKSGCQRKDEPTEVFQGHHDNVRHCPAPDGYTPDPSVCGIGVGRPQGYKRSISHAVAAKGGHHAHTGGKHHPRRDASCSA